MDKKIFISYRRDDTFWVTTSIYQSLLRHFPKDQIFRDIESIPFGVDFHKIIEEEVSKCDVLIVIIGNDWLQFTDANNTLENSADYVRIEIATAFEQGVQVIPVLVDGAEMPKPHELPNELKPLSRISALPFSHTRFNADTQQLIETLQKTLDTISLRKSQTPGIQDWRFLSITSKDQLWVSVLIIAITVSSLFAGFILSAMTAVIIQDYDSSNKVELDSSLGIKLFVIYTLLTLAGLSILLVRAYKKRSRALQRF